MRQTNEKASSIRTSASLPIYPSLQPMARQLVNDSFAKKVNTSEKDPIKWWGEWLYFNAIPRCFCNVKISHLTITGDSCLSTCTTYYFLFPWNWEGYFAPTRLIRMRRVFIQRRNKQSSNYYHFKILLHSPPKSILLHRQNEILMHGLDFISSCFHRNELDGWYATLRMAWLSMSTRWRTRWSLPLPGSWQTRKYLLPLRRKPLDLLPLQPPPIVVFARKRWSWSLISIPLPSSLHLLQYFFLEKNDILSTWLR